MKSLFLASLAGIAASACLSNTDCGPEEWCRDAQSADGMCSETKVCTRKVGEGQSCGGFTLTCFQEACQSGLSCVQQDPMLADAPGICQRDTKPTSCTSDDDCGKEEWCRTAKAEDDFACIRSKVCTPKVGEGQSCGGLTIPCFYDVCQSGLSCIQQDPMIADAPGICQRAPKDVCEGKALCGGIAGFQCADQEVCIAGSNNGCAQNGGADCGGCCVKDPCMTVRCAAGPCTVSDIGEAVCGLQRPSTPHPKRGRGRGRGRGRRPQ